MLAGPSEVVLIADDTANPEWLAADLLAQAEHSPDARAYLLTPSATLAQAVQQQIGPLAQKLKLPRYVRESSLAHSAMLLLDSLAECCEVSNLLAPEHLHLHVEDSSMLEPQLRHYGTLFAGAHATVAFGDYAAGPNHTLPTGRSARFSGALSPLTYLRLQNTLHVGAPNPYLANLTAALAQLEGLQAHAYSAQLRS
jgi:histidinol dehydrogenase